MDKSLTELITELKWYIENRWMSEEHHEDAKRLANEISQIIKGNLIEEDSSTSEVVVEVPLASKQKKFLPPTWLVSSGTLPIVGRRFSRESFIQYVRWLQKNESYTWKPKGITMHHTAYPDLSMRPHGFTEQHMLNIRHGYLQKNWSHGPHIFTDDKGIWVFSPLSQKGIHAVSFNNTRYGIEMLGNFEKKKDFNDPRGVLSRENGQFVAAVLMKYANISTAKLNFHRHDHETSKSCPGKHIGFSQFEDEVLEIYKNL